MKATVFAGWQEQSRCRGFAKEPILFSSKKSLQRGHKVADELQRLQINSCKIKNRLRMTSLKKKKKALRIESLLCFWVLS